jgi:hypothetical protein
LVWGQDATVLLPPEEHARFSAAVLAALRGRPTANYEVRLPRAGAGAGGHVLLSFNIASVVGADGESPDEVIAVGQDLTEIRRLQRQMIHTEKLATIGQLAAGVVHEINNPLTSVSIHADYLAKLMEREKRSTQEITFINRIRDAAARILRFTQDLMSFARPAGDEPEQFDLPAVIDQSAAFCEHVIAKAGVNIRAISIADTADFGILRVIVDQPEAATEALVHAGFTTRVTDVLAVEIPDQPGSLAKVMALFKETGVNIEYLYASLEGKTDKAIVIFKVEDVALRVLAERHPERPLKTNVEYYAAAVLQGVGLTPDLFPATFALARHAGWTAHVLEQVAANKLIRPDARYVGPAERDLPG